MIYRWYDAVGNVGVACVLVTYLLVQLGRLTPTSMIYGGLNALGAILILISLSQRFNLSSVIIEICWLLISLIGVVRAWRLHQQRASQGKP